MGGTKRVTNAPHPHLHLLTVVSPRKDAGSSPTGIVGRSLARQLLDAGDRVRVLAEPDQVDRWPDGVEVVEGSITRPREHAEVFTGVDGVFLAGAVPTTVTDALRAARDAGVRRVVVLSSHGPEYEEAYPPETWFWLAIERAVERSGLEWTHIRPSAVMGAMIEGTYPATGSDWQDTIRGERVVREAFLNGGHYPFIHEDDLAAVAVAALRTDDHVGAVLEAVGLPISTRSRVASIARAIGQDIAAVEVSPDDSRATWRRRGWPDSGIDVTLYALEEYGERLEELTRWTLDQRPSVREIIGRPPRGFDEWAMENAHLFL
ncbi:Nucleoside-diphosphate-sugar epimerase [Streptoalloteichus tenebrarius]|uniref:Nucleoside-diphosphate-sugar epimerase n=1 Tax=Streptoalloteichus tenebrarius (strain ATCC 17920 / DSM 40477 / JCM 4838 / CBS 697.72 / NBRC 16177 / NCIMB 11028 / NRRL B-12390 / A12253. 1 / ISP 5477) TaxID=1933 RepID=A0ABT1HZJ6_STRSD|nr:NAD(P)H-binding protein [Streptoalloteichus tenebrarius]MCP2260957.1 Nucleoside-diphosphate-sugar epimerase [Streptoalloteichus tenebrarius]BFE98894.1 NAD(P)H-binding protein [Streptoalloteichus tenebrarius]